MAATISLAEHSMCLKTWGGINIEWVLIVGVAIVVAIVVVAQDWCRHNVT